MEAVRRFEREPSWALLLATAIRRLSQQLAVLLPFADSSSMLPSARRYRHDY